MDAERNSRPFGRCLKCGYLLVGSAPGHCPECGCAFDPYDLRTYRYDPDDPAIDAPPSPPCWPRLRVAFETVVAANAVVLLEAFIGIGLTHHLFEKLHPQWGEWVMLFCLLVSSSVAALGLLTLKIVDQPPRRFRRVRQVAFDVAAAGMWALLIYGTVQGMAGIYHEAVAMIWWGVAVLFWLVPAVVRRRPTPMIVDAALLAILAILAWDALYYLRHSDVRWGPWYRWFTDLESAAMLGVAAAFICPFVWAERYFQMPWVKWVSVPILWGIGWAGGVGVGMN